MKRPRIIALALALAGTLALALAQEDPAPRGAGGAPDPNDASGSRADAAAPTDLTVPFERFVLDNGLTLLVHEDPKAPVAAVNVWYHVGSRDEPEGRTGFAHLFEHLMFQGTENHPGEILPTLIAAGATTLNGTTNVDRTNYFETVPTSALDLALFVESERMGHLAGALTEEALETQTSVVQNEKRQAENGPYGRVRSLVATNAYPPHHPYAHDVFGSMEDLQAATLDDAREWLETHYGPNNAVLVVAGDVEAEDVRDRVEHWFGDIAPGPSPTRHAAWPAPLAREKRLTLTDRVPEPRLFRVWNVAPWASTDAAHLELVTNLLADGSASRLQRGLVRAGLATYATARLEPGELGSQLWIEASPAPGVALADVDAAIGEILSDLARNGPDAEELRRVQARFEGDLLRGLQTVGGFGGKSDLLAMHEVFAGDAATLETRLDTYAEATPDDLRRVVGAWLGANALVLEVRPEPALAAATEGADRSTVPQPGEPPAASFPELQRTRLDNGLRIVLLERHDLPLVEARLVLDAGVAADPPGAPGTATLTAAALLEGTSERSGTEIAEAAAALGARLNAGNGLDSTYLMLSTLRRTLPEALDLLAEVALDPAFPAAEVERLKGEQLAQIAREGADPGALALRVLPGLVFGEDHPYGTPWTGSGEADAVAALGAADLRAFHETWFHPSDATLLVAGDVTLADLEPLVREAFGGWAPGEAPAKAIPPAPAAEAPVLYLLDRPGSIQSLVLAAQPLPEVVADDEVDLELLNGVLGGSFASRTNRNLRQEKGWTYGAYTQVPDARGTRLLLAYAPVQSDRTADAVAELDREIRGIVGDAPVTADELAFARRERVAGLAGTWQTLSALAGAATRIVDLDLPDGFYDGYAAALDAATLEEVRALAERAVRPDRLTWVVVGDRAAIEAPLRELGIAEVRVLDEAP